MNEDASARPRGLSARQAYVLEMAIVAASILALVMIFQPFWLALFSVGAAAVVIVGFLFNLVPLLRPGVRVATLVKATVAIVVIFVIVTALSLASAELYAYYISPVD